MDIELILSNSKWGILSELSKEPRSPIELASIFKTTLANISQQLRLMEAMGIIGKTKVSNFEKGKPRMQYYIKEEIFYMARLGKNFASKQSIKKDPFTIFIFNAFALLNKKDQYFLIKFYCDNFDILIESSIGILKNQENLIELFIITEKLDEARKRISNTELKSPHGTFKKIVCWSHNLIETQQGVKNNDPHFLNLVKESTILIDEKGALERFKEIVVGK